MDRRNFLKSAALGAGMLAVPGLGARTLRAEEAKKQVVLNLCSQDGRIPGASLQEKIEKLKKWGATGIEFGGLTPERAKEIKAQMKGSGLKVSALCWGSHNGDLVSLDKDKRAKGIADLKRGLEAAGELEARGAIFVPCFNKQSELKPEELDKILADILPELGDYAKKCNTAVLLEPLNQGETFYINRIEQAAAICNKLNNDGICLMGDFYHMSKEEKDQEQAFITGGKWLRHVHLATGKKRILPGEEPHSYVEGMRGLKKMGYTGFCSLECGIKKGADPEVEIPKAFDYLRQQWEAATV
jgi:sugar phosphate isomerase/epimerase